MACGARMRRANGSARTRLDLALLVMLYSTYISLKHLGLGFLYLPLFNYLRFRRLLTLSIPCITLRSNTGLGDLLASALVGMHALFITTHLLQYYCLPIGRIITTLLRNEHRT